jgi:hypothetical protein
LSEPHGFFEDTISLVKLGADRGMVMVVGVDFDEVIKIRKERRKRSREEAMKVLFSSFSSSTFFFLVMISEGICKDKKVESFCSMLRVIVCL